MPKRVARRTTRSSDRSANKMISRKSPRSKVAKIKHEKEQSHSGTPESTTSGSSGEEDDDRDIVDFDDFSDESIHSQPILDNDSLYDATDEGRELPRDRKELTVKSRSGRETAEMADAAAERVAADYTIVSDEHLADNDGPTISCDVEVVTLSDDDDEVMKKVVVPLVAAADPDADDVVVVDQEEAPGDIKIVVNNELSWDSEGNDGPTTSRKRRKCTGGK